MKRMRLTALLLAMLAAMAVTVNAEEAEPAEPAETAAVEETAEEVNDFAVIAFPEMLPVGVTSSMSEPNSDTSVFFDRLASTGYEFTVTEDCKVYSLYTSVGVRDYVDQFAAMISGEHYTSITVSMFASNDHANWVQLDVAEPTLENGFHVFRNIGDGERYTYYRFDFSVEMGEGFTLSEFALFKTDLGEPEYVYNLGDSVEIGELPELIPVVEEEPAPAEKPTYKRLPMLIGFCL